MAKRLFILLFLIAGLSAELLAQSSNQYQIANRLMQRQQYEEAQIMLKRLTAQNPEVFLYFERLIGTYIQLKEYDEALSLVQNNIQENINPDLSRVLEAQLYHFKDDTVRANKIWMDNLYENPNQLQLYINTANAMLDRRAYERAIEVYRLGRKVFNNEQLFYTDVPNAFMQAGKYDEAIGEWIQVIKDNPDQKTGLQRLLLRYNDPLLYDISILEIDDMLAALSLEHPAYENFYELQIWLLLENELYRRAFATAKEYEIKTENYNFRLFNVGRKLVENEEYELALDAFNFYITNSFGEVRWRAMEEKASALTHWAKYLDEYSLDFSGTKNELFKRAALLLDSVSTQTQNYSRINQIYLKKAEISLDFVFNMTEAEEALENLKNIPGMADTPEVNYLDGRIYLAKAEYTSARISLTRANKKAGVGELAEKTRYFLALTDFYSGDFEFAKIQLKSLGRQNTSYYANDALELRLWVQEGLAADSTGNQLKAFSDAINKMNMGGKTESTTAFLDMLNEYPQTPLYDDVLLHLSRTTSFENQDFAGYIIDYINRSEASPLREQLMWIRARSSEVTTLSTSDSSAGLTDVSPVELYEKLILEYPQGFYAPYARKRLSELPKSNS